MCKLYQPHRLLLPAFLLLLGLLPASMRAQLCTGSLGDPVVKIDFGSGTGRGPALGSSITTYTYSSSGFPMDGYYTIANTTAGLLSNWWTTTDHTGNTNGYMMVVNASYGAGVFYTKTVDGLCPGTTYEFAAWVMNLFNVTTNPNPNLTFKISTTGGTVLGTYTTGDIVANASKVEWKQFGFYFTTTTETQVVITIINNAPGAAPGNDLVLDDITFRPCGPLVTASLAGGGSSKDLCQGSATTLSFVSTISTGYSNPSYQWQVSTNGGTSWADIAGATGSTYTRPASDTGVYLYRLTVANGSNISSSTCRVASGNIAVTVHANPDPAPSSNNPVCFGDTLKLLAASGGATYAWTGPNGFTSSLQDPVINDITAANNGTYSVILTTAYGCSSTGTVRVAVNGRPWVSAGADTTICEGTSATLRGSGGGTLFSWTPAATLSNSTISAPVATPVDTTAYILSVSNGQCKGFDTVVVNVWKKPVANAGPNKVIVEGSSVQLNGTAGGTDVDFTWSPAYNINSSTALLPTVWPTTDTTYVLTVVSEHGCGRTSDDVFVRVYKKITVPDAFSPNGDGINDTWLIDKLATYPEADVNVFNRYGQLVFRSRGYARPWDGTYNGLPLPVGTYYYVIDLKTGFGNPSGWVAILR